MDVEFPIEYPVGIAGGESFGDVMDFSSLPNFLPTGLADAVVVEAADSVKFWLDIVDRW